MDDDVDMLMDDVPSDSDVESGIEVEYGVRQSRRRTNFARRDSSSLYPVQFMDIEYYLAAFEFAMSTARNMMPLLSFIISLERAKRVAISTWERSTRPVAAVGARLRDELRAVGAALSELRFLLGWISAFGELALLYVGDLTYYV